MLSTANNFHKTAICHLRHRGPVSSPFYYHLSTLCPRNFLSTRDPKASTFLTLIFHHSRFPLCPRPSLPASLFTRRHPRGKGLAACVIIYEHIVYAFAFKEFVTPSALRFCYVCFSTTYVRTCLLAGDALQRSRAYVWLFMDEPQTLEARG